ncbi:pentatricopeptide repeat-containing protein At1g09190 [Mercurialis annua]|uniref:pentatricopeptide repeat-containing protein At1g09190 n=1 Tax=Mercurialis annua TaxID=3986 RepID=UPI00215DF5A0|nr:pentatricopeptide repeat-containing protein At1g09190 [Mercurialis annua]
MSRETERKILRLLHGHKTRTQLCQIHAHFLRHGLDQLNHILAHFISVCGSQNKMAYANRVFLQAQNPSILPFNAMIKGYSLSGPYENSVSFFMSMRERGICPDEYTFAPLLKACSNICTLKLGQCVHKDAIVLGFECFSSIRIGVVELYAKCGMLEDAGKLFDEMCERDVIVWNLMIRGYCKRGDVDMGLYLFRKMSERSVVSWNLMISCLAQSGRFSEALELFHEMRDRGVKPDEATIVTVLPICARLEAVSVGQEIKSYAESSGLYRDFVSVGNALVDFYSKCGMLETARSVFDEMPQKSVVSWNSMISAMAFNGKGEVGLDLFEEMINKGMKPNEATFVAVLSCCSHAGLVERGSDLFASMTANHQIKPKLEHYGCMVDLLGRCGCVREAYELIKSMIEAPNASLWGSLLSACRTHGEMELAQVSVQELINLEPSNSGNYVLLSNMYAEEKKWDKVEEVRAMMRDRNIKKESGQSAVG